MQDSHNPNEKIATRKLFFLMEFFFRTLKL